MEIVSGVSVVTKYILLLIGTALLLGSFAALLLYPDLRGQVQQKVNPSLQLVVTICLAYSVYHWFARRWK